jgi:DNA modification methylase
LPRKAIVLHEGEALEFLRELPSSFVSLVVTSPPYNLGKAYERKRALEIYLKDQAHIIQELVRLLRDDGSICWEVGNFVDDGEVFPLEVGTPDPHLLILVFFVPTGRASGRAQRWNR